MPFAEAIRPFKQRFFYEKIAAFIGALLSMLYQQPDMKNVTLALLFLFFAFPIGAQAPVALRIALNWEALPGSVTVEGTSYERWRSADAVLSDEMPTLPWVIRQFPVNTAGTLSVEIINARFEPFERQATLDDDFLEENIRFVTQVARDRQGYSAQVSFVPIVKNGSRYERLVEAELRVRHNPQPVIRPRGPEGTRTSVLNDGEIYKFSVSATGMHKLTYDFLKNRLGISNLDNIDPRTIKIFGNGGGMLPAYTEAERPDDLVENHVLIIGEADGKFDPSDYILLYAEGADKWVFDGGTQFNLQKNIYDDVNYYFIKISPGNGRRVTEQPSLGATAFTSTAFNDFARFEEDKVNLLYDWGQRTGKAQGSGQRWYGDWFRNAREYTYNNLFSFPNIISGAPAQLRVEMALRALQRSGFTVSVNGQSFSSPTATAVSTFSGERDNEQNYAHRTAVETQLTLNAPNVNVQVRYPHPAGANDGSEGWLDFVQLNVRRQLIMTGNQLIFRDIESLAHPNTTFQLDNANQNLLVWDISEPLAPRNQAYTLSGTTLRFGVSTTTLRTFVAFNRNFDFPTPQPVGRISNQNLHGLDNVDMLIVYHPEFLPEAQRLADHRRRHSSLEVALAPIDQIYNEFSSGRQDATAIRDFARLLYERNNRFQYLLLLGDGSFDNKDFYKNGTNFLPTYQTESLNPIFAFPSDDYYAILYGTDPGNPLVGNMSIDVGRLPVKSLMEAQGVINKIIHYDTNPATLGEWRNRMVFVGDDEDNNIHVRDADRIANKMLRENPFLNVNKIYLDAFPQIAASGGNRFPAAKEEINRSIFRGILAITYLGHGGEIGWAQERVLEIPDITSWTNFDQLPLFVTATCSFTGYDNPTFTTAGEETLLNPRGGAIALLTTVRAVFASENARLTEAALEQLFSKETGDYPSLGAAMRLAKNSYTNPFTVTNSRKFSLIGDPALQLAIPRMGVRTTDINARPVTTTSQDTIRALQRVTVKGELTDNQGQPLTNFNGIVFPTVFDKATVTSTLVQDNTGPRPSLPFDFTVQRNIIFRGRASVNNGRFQFSFVVPRDINYQFGPGKVSYYAANEATMSDATGYYERVIIGGTDPNAVADTRGPDVEVYMNTEDFVFGGITNKNPTLLVKLEDENGINVVGNSIGHDLEAILNNNTQNTFLLNDFYESDLDDYRRGTVRYPLFNLPEGRHEMRVSAWDVANNPAQGYTEFFVAASGKIALERVLNYPNPFTDRTCFQFDHNMAGQQLDVLIQIFTISGRLVKTLQQTVFSDGALRLGDCIEWDGRDDFGDRLARGVYLYKVKVRTGAGSSAGVSGESDFEKLVILK